MTDAARETPPELAAHYAHCGDVLRGADRDAWLAALFAPQEARRNIHAIYAFAAEITGVRAKVSEPLLGEMRLRWWLDAIEGADAGARAHPVAAALLDTIERFALPRADFAALIEARAFDLYDEPMPTMAALEDYCRAAAARPMAWAARILGEAGGADAARALENAGIALGLVRILTALPWQAAAGQCFVPADLLARCGASPAEVRSGRSTPGVRSSLKELREAARSRYEVARGAARGMGAGRAALLPASVVPLYLDALEGAAGEPLRSFAVPAQWRRQWRLWRAARGVGL